VYEEVDCYCYLVRSFTLTTCQQHTHTRMRTYILSLSLCSLSLSLSLLSLSLSLTHTHTYRYGKTACAVVNEQTGQLYLFALSKDGKKKTNTFDLFSPGVYAVSVVDNVLIVHHILAQVRVCVCVLCVCGCV